MSELRDGLAVAFEEIATYRELLPALSVGPSVARAKAPSIRFGRIDQDLLRQTTVPVIERSIFPIVERCRSANGALRTVGRCCTSMGRAAPGWKGRWT